MMRLSRGLGLLPGEFNGATQARLDAAYPEKMYFGWGNFGPFDRPMTVGLFGTPATYNWFKSTFGRAPLAVFNNPLFDSKPVEAGQEPRYSAIVQALRAIDVDLANYHGPVKNMSAGPPVSFAPDSPAYTGVVGSTIVFNTPGGATTVTDGVVVTGGAGGAGSSKPQRGGGDEWMIWGAGLAVALGVGFLFSRKG